MKGTVGPFWLEEYYGYNDSDTWHLDIRAFSCRGLAFELRSFPTDGAGDRQYRVVLVTRGTDSGDYDADEFVFGERYEPFEFIYEWTHAPDSESGVRGLVNELTETPYALEGIVLLNAGYFIDRLERYEASLREVA